MRVFAKGQAGEHSGLTQGRTYVVVGVDDQHYRVMDDAGEPILFPKELFSVVDGTIPSGWVRVEYDDGEYHIDPLETSGVGFYEDYFDRDERAVAAFNRAYEVLAKGQE